MLHYNINKNHLKWFSHLSSLIGYIAITCLNYDRAVRCILLLCKYIISNASSKQTETDGLHILREAIPDIWALILVSALPGTCSTVGSMQLTIFACKMRMEISIHSKVIWYIEYNIIQIVMHKQ